jgi:uncharacterized protein (DUF4415 family)
MPRKTEPVIDDSNPEWTAKDFARAVKFKAPVPLAEAATIAAGRGRPKLAAPKQSVTLRIDADVLDAYRATGPGWQSRINSALRRSSRKIKAGGR